MAGMTVRWLGRFGTQRRRTWLLSGIPRSGSSLCCRLAGQAADTVALTEPIGEGLMDVADPAEACVRIERFVRQTRARIRHEGRAPALTVDGALADDLVSNDAAAGLRRAVSERGDIAVGGSLSKGFTLVVKHNALFAALLPRLSRRFPCVGLVRNPLAVLASWRSVDLAVHDGHVPVGERFDPGLARTLATQPSALARQVLILDWFFERFITHLPAQRILRYEDVVKTGGVALHRALGVAAPPAESLTERNANALYDGAAAVELLAALLAGRRTWTALYSLADCERLADILLRRRGASSWPRAAPHHASGNART